LFWKKPSVFKVVFYFTVIVYPDRINDLGRNLPSLNNYGRKIMEKTKACIDYKRTVINGKTYYGKHLMLTAVYCNENLLDLTMITSFLKELVPTINMTAYGEPIVARFGNDIEVGVSAVQLITTSAITLHTNDAARDMYLDVFSCKWFDEAIVRDVVNKYFGPESMTSNVFLRE
jgi:S-adenosylmethionine/arginine decarboxylase-like enzyme